jgi:polyphosphate glucokinase
VASGTRTLCIDIGGTGIKALVLDANGKPVTERLRVETPRPATPRALRGAIVELARRQGAFDRVSVGFPGVVRRGVTETAFNLHPSWVGVNLERLLESALRRPVRAANDADVQGLGAVRGKGVELVITLGTGFGSSLFTDGHLVPNVQLGHHAAWRRKTYEEELGQVALKKAGRKKWNRRVRKAIETLEATFSYDRLYVGGGNAPRIRPPLPPRVKIISNLEGLLGGIALWETKEKPRAAR